MDEDATWYGSRPRPCKVGLVVFDGGAILSVSHPSVKVLYIGTRNVQLMHCSGSNLCWRLGTFSGKSKPWSLPSEVLGLAPRENFEIYINAECKIRESTSMMVWPTLSRMVKEQNRSHAKHESGLIVTDVLWSLGHDCEPCKSR